MNKWIGYGNVGKDPEVRSTNSGKKVAQFSFATSEYRKDESGQRVTDTTWHNIVMWDKLAELAEKHVKKGSSLIIEGRISNRSYEDKKGEKKYITEIIGTGLHFISSPKSETKTQLDLAAESQRFRDDLHNDDPFA